MAKKQTEAASTEDQAPEVAPTKQGRAITLPNGERRIDYIRRRYYEEKATRSEIAKELTEMCGKTVPYQIVFAATKEKLGEPMAEGGEGGEATAEPASEATE